MTLSTQAMGLDAVVWEHKQAGSHPVPAALGAVTMPVGYALMVDPDDLSYYGLRWDGTESTRHWDRWAIYRWAKAQKEAD